MKQNFDKLSSRVWYGSVTKKLISSVASRLNEGTAIQLGINLLKMSLFSNRNIHFISLVG